MRYLLFVLLVLTIYALVDCVRNDDTDTPVDLPKPLWVVLILFLPLVGPVAWLLVSRAGRARQQPSPAGGRSPLRPNRPPRPRPVAPDDDPEFLAGLNVPEPTAEPPAQDAPSDRTDGEEAGGRAGRDEPGEEDPDSGPASGEGPGPRR